MNKQLKSLIFMLIIGGILIFFYNQLNKTPKVKVLNQNDYKSTFTQQEHEKLDGITSASVVPKEYIQQYKSKGFTNSDKKKVLFIIGDPRENSVLYDMSTTAIKWFEDNNMEVEVRDLYRMNWNPVLHPDEFYFQKDGIGTPSEDVKKEQDLIKKADFIVFAYPNWHDTPIAIVKGYQERVFSKGFAYTSTPNGPQGLLKNKGLFTIMNCGYLGGGQGYVGDSIKKPNEMWDKYMTAYSILDEDQAKWWGMDNYGRFVNDIYPKNNSANYKQEINSLRDKLKSYLAKTFK